MTVGKSAPFEFELNGELIKDLDHINTPAHLFLLIYGVTPTVIPESFLRFEDLVLPLCVLDD